MKSIPKGVGPFALAGAVALTGCGGGSSSNGDNGNGDPGDNGDVSAAANCEADVAIPFGSGLDTDAGFDPLNHFYVFDDKLCGFLPSSGEGFEADSGLVPDDGGADVEVVIWSGDAATGGGLENVEVDRVVYTADDEIRFAKATTGSAGDPEIGRISTEDEAFDITVMRPGFSTTDGSDHLAYIKNEEWFSVTVGGGAGADPQAFGDNQAPLGALYEDNSITGWLVHDGNQGTVQAVHPQDLDQDLYGGDALIDDAGGMAFFVSVTAQFEDSTTIVQVLDNDESQFYQIDPAEDEADDAADNLGNIESETITARASRGDTLFAAAEVNNRAHLYRIDEGGVTRIDQGDVDTEPVFMVPTDDRVVWGVRDEEAQIDQVVSVTHAGSGEETLAQSPSGEETLFGTAVMGSANGWVYFNEVGVAAGGFEMAAYAAQADGSDTRTFEDAQWQGASNPADVFVLTPAGGQRISEVFLVETENPDPALESPQTIKAFDATDPDPEDNARFVNLGQLEEEATGPAVLMGSIGLGPHRFITTGNDLVHVDTSSSSNASETVVTDPEDVPRFRTISGF